MIKLVANLHGQIVGSWEFDDARSFVKIGRADANQVQIENLAFSSFHAEIRLEGGVYQLRDLASSNATFVNGEQITHHNLNDQDSIGIGKHVITVFLGAQVLAVAPVPRKGGYQAMAVTAPTKRLGNQGRVQDDSRAFLVRRDKQGNQIYIPVKRGGASIGSGSDSTVVLRGWRRLPRRLALVVCGFGGYSLLNFATKPGEVRLNGSLVGVRTWLADGDEIKVAGSVFTFVEETEAP